jgi:hypothetical protein
MRSSGSSNGRIARIQGIKTTEQKMLQVLPKLWVNFIYSFKSKLIILYRFL